MLSSLQSVTLNDSYTQTFSKLRLIHKFQKTCQPLTIKLW